MATLDELVVKLRADTQRLERDLSGARKQLNKTDKKAKQVSQSMERSFGGVKLAVTAVAAALTGVFAKSLINTITTFEKLEASLKTVTGSAKAASSAFDEIQEFAATTPFQLEEVVDAFIKLKALGLDPSMEALRSYGNTASAMGKSINQMIEAVADAATGEFERLKEFGIRARNQGDEITFTFQGVTTTVENSASDIVGYLQGIGEVQFAGAMAEQADTLNVSISNLQDEFAKLAKAIGDAGLTDLLISITGEMRELVIFAGKMVNQFEQLNLAKTRQEFIELGEEITDLTLRQNQLNEQLSEGAESGFFARMLGNDADSIKEESQKITQSLEQLRAKRAQLLEEIHDRQGFAPGQGGEDQTPGEQQQSIPGMSQVQQEQLEKDLEKLREFFMTKEEIELQEAEKRLERIQEIFESEMELKEGQREKLLELEQLTAEQIVAIKENQRKEEKKIRDKQLQDQESGFRSLLSSAAQNNKALFEINKAFALADAVLGARKAIQDAYEWGTSIAGPPGGAIAAATAAAATAANIAAIASSSFGGGGSASSPATASGGSVGNIEQAAGSVSGGGAPSPGQDININVTSGLGDRELIAREIAAAVNEAADQGIKFKINGAIV